MEARLTQTRSGLVAEGDGWFVLNARDARWRDTGPFGLYCAFEGKRRFPQLGINISVLDPGQGLGKYHAEPGHQEGFLVLAGTCVLIVEDETRDLEAWDFFHCPPNTPHMIVGSGETPAVVLCVGTRGSGRGVSRGVVYVVSKVARRFGVSVKKETSDPREAYADAPRWRALPYREGLLP